MVLPILETPIFLYASGVGLPYKRQSMSEDQANGDVKDEGVTVRGHVGMMWHGRFDACREPAFLCMWVDDGINGECNSSIGGKP